jgi:hypothetical protein
MKKNVAFIHSDGYPSTISIRLAVPVLSRPTEYRPRSAPPCGSDAAQTPGTHDGAHLRRLPQKAHSSFARKHVAARTQKQPLNATGCESRFFKTGGLARFASGAKAELPFRIPRRFAFRAPDRQAAGFGVRARQRRFPRRPRRCIQDPIHPSHPFPFKYLRFYSFDNDSFDYSGLSSLHPASSFCLRPAALCSFVFSCVLLWPHYVSVLRPAPPALLFPSFSPAPWGGGNPPGRILNICYCIPIKQW